MNDTDIRLECVRLALGDLTNAIAIYHWVTGRDATAKLEKPKVD